jgi:hypothetical protein
MTWAVVVSHSALAGIEDKSVDFRGERCGNTREAKPG